MTVLLKKKNDQVHDKFLLKNWLSLKKVILKFALRMQRLFFFLSILFGYIFSLQMQNIKISFVYTIWHE